jgi:hypothetical protein
MEGVEKFCHATGHHGRPRTNFCLIVNVLRKTLDKLEIRKTRIDNPETCGTLFMYQVVHIKELMSAQCIMGSGYVTFHLSLNVQAYAG